MEPVARVLLNSAVVCVGGLRVLKLARAHAAVFANQLKEEGEHAQHREKAQDRYDMGAVLD